MHFFATLAKILSLPFGNDYNSTIFTEPRSEMLSLPETLYPSEPTNVRSYFSQTACHVHGHPSSGGILIKHFANLVDLQFLSLPNYNVPNGLGQPVCFRVNSWCISKIRVNPVRAARLLFKHNPFAHFWSNLIQILLCVKSAKFSSQIQFLYKNIQRKVLHILMKFR
jgi:hypothetical protein